MPTRIIELILEIVLQAMKDQPIEVKAELWRMHLEDIKKWREFWENIGPDKKP